MPLKLSDCSFKFKQHSPHLAHQLIWNRFINTHGGLGHIIPCDLHNEHLNKLVKSVITNQGPNFTEAAIQRAPRSVTTLQAVIAKFDQQSNVPPISNSYSTKSLEQKVVSTVLKQEILCQTRQKTLFLSHPKD